MAPSRKDLARLLAIAWLAIPGACASPTSTSTSAQKTCKTDLECGAHRYCSAGRVCTSDCIDDADCIGPVKDAQCNVHGRCIAPPSDGGAPEGGGP